MSPSTKKQTETSTLDDNPLWYKSAVIYELHVRAFCDGNGDGIGDFRGLTRKLDYLQDLGVTALWLLPFYPSPLKDDGYDIADYTDIHPDYGTLHDFKTFLREAHRRGLRVITELVVNHTSDQHPWFQRARQAKPGSKAREFYVWSDSPDRYREARIIFKDFEPSNWSWDPTAKAYYWHRFYAHQPDLNFDNPEVRKALLNVLDFWLDMGVDGMRLDAVPYLYERDGTNCENLPETHAFLRELRRHVDATYKNRMLLAEANQWPEDAVAYFGTGDECHMCFHFPVMPRLFMALHMEDRFPIIDILEQTPDIPPTNQWAVFLRNHDELTLEMVTDEDRDYMYRVYANDPRARINLGIRRRLAPLVGNSRRKNELLNSLLFSLPGTPVIYYGDEIGMGDNIYLGDRNGVRTPMQWSADRNAGFSRANPQQLYLPVVIAAEHHYEAVNVEVQQQNFSSLLWWTKRLILLRKRYLAFGQGSIEFLFPENRKVLAFIRRFEDESILVVANLSRFVNYAELDLSAYEGMTPVELFGQNVFPRIGGLPYFITLGPHAFYWFKLEDHAKATPATETLAASLPSLQVATAWDAVFRDRGRSAFEQVLPRYLATCRWYGGKARRLRVLKIVEAIPFPVGRSQAYIMTVTVEYADGIPETYLLPVAFAPGEEANRIRDATPAAVIASFRITDGGIDGILYDALADGRFCAALLDAIAHRRRFKGALGELHAVQSRGFREARGPEGVALEASPLQREQTNTSVMFGNRLILKVFRRISDGINPDLEVARFLADETDFRHVPPLAGALEYRPAKGEPASFAILHGFVANEGDAWSYTLDQLRQFYERAVTRPVPPDPLPVPREHMVDLLAAAIPPAARDAIGPYLHAAELLGQRTAEMHLALASRPADPAFAPEAFTPLYRRSLYQSLRSHADKTLALLQSRLTSLPATVRPDAERVLASESALFDRLRRIVDVAGTAMRLRCHGDYHLGQLLYTGKDFVIIDFEGEPARPISERRLKRSPLIDVAGMLRSFSYASVVALQRAALRPEDLPGLEPSGRLWNLWTSVVFLRAYLAVAGQGTFLPRSSKELKVLLDVLILEKVAYELSYELNNRPGWVNIPLRGILDLLEQHHSV
jgi:maltose alpha-D-glucosyltransferase/alpha-amylase